VSRLFIVKLNVIMANVVMLSVIMANVVMLNVIMLSVVALLTHRMGQSNNLLVQNALAYLSEMAKKSFERCAPENKGRVPFRT
jgi:hypothetical protein